MHKKWSRRSEHKRKIKDLQMLKWIKSKKVTVMTSEGMSTVKMQYKKKNVYCCQMRSWLSTSGCLKKKSRERFNVLLNFKVCLSCQAVLRSELFHEGRPAGSQRHRSESAFTDGVQFSISKQDWYSQLQIQSENAVQIVSQDQWATSLNVPAVYPK